MAALETVTCKGKTVSLLPHIYWHLAAEHSFLYHNVANHEGLSPTISLLNMVENIDAVSPYSLKARGDEKENVWERVRKEQFADKPPRSGAIWLFQDEGAADTASQTWFKDEKRNKVSAQIVAGSQYCHVDTRWLDGNDPAAWEDRAAQYWRGEITDDPVIETVVMGAVYFPDWRQPPFGLFVGLAPAKPV